MKILLVTQFYYPSLGGVETHVQQVAHQLIANGHQVQVAAVNFSACQLSHWFERLHGDLLAPSFPSYLDGSLPIHSLSPNWFDRLRLLPILVRTLPRLRTIAYRQLLLFGYQFYRPVFSSKLRKLAHDADLIHSFNGWYLGWVAQHVAQQLKIPFVNTPFVHPSHWGDDPDNVAYYKRADAIIALHEGDRQSLLSLEVPKQSLHTIGVSPNLPAIADPDAFRTQYNLGEAPVILFVGRMVVHKGVKAILESTQQVWKTAPDARFIFIGPSTPESETWFKDADVRILYLGKVSNQEKANALAACDVFCMPSTSEILPTVYLEAWSYKKPVIGGKAKDCQSW
ncbi:MAG: glycosyltransferase family 4 protein [Leptolyngbyaceae cyanobacterium SM1_4_3]|nr:glycosyltransferase family 4 protein [Leptolyngbyaceae cyanobacterium SM1_4_3]